MSLNIFEKINNLTTDKKYKVVLYIAASILVAFVVFKTNKLTVSSVKEQIKDAGAKAEKNKDAFGKSDLSEEEIKKKLEQIRKKCISNIEKKEKEKKNEVIKKEIVPEIVVESDVNNMDKIEQKIQEKIQLVKKEEGIINQFSLFSKLAQVEKKYKERVEKKQIRYGRTVKTNDLVYYSMSIGNSIEYEVDGKIQTKALEDGEEGRFIIKIVDGDKMSKHIINRKIGDYFVLKMGDIVEDQSKINSIINDGILNDPNYKGAKINISNFKYKVTILDIIPVAIIKELKLEEF
jgi:hypothetical protein